MYVLGTQIKDRVPVTDSFIIEIEKAEESKCSM